MKASTLFFHLQYFNKNVFVSVQFQAHAVADGAGKAEAPMYIAVSVIDQNDNNPIFTQTTYLGEVAESSAKGIVSRSHFSLKKIQLCFSLLQEKKSRAELLMFFS